MYLANMSKYAGIFSHSITNKILGIDGWIILGRISKWWDVGIWTGLGLPRIETGGGRL